MIRGSTVTHIFNIPLEANDIKELKITYAQGDNIVFFKKKNECTVADNTIAVTLTQNDTFKLDSSQHVKIQLRILTDKDVVMSSKVITRSVDACLDNEVLK